MTYFIIMAYLIEETMWKSRKPLRRREKIGASTRMTIINGKKWR